MKTPTMMELVLLRVLCSGGTMTTRQVTDDANNRRGKNPYRHTSVYKRLRSMESSKLVTSQQQATKSPSTLPGIPPIEWKVTAAGRRSLGECQKLVA